MKNLGKYHDLYVWNNTLLQADVVKNSWNMCLEMYEFHPSRFLSAPGLAWQGSLKDKSKIRSVNCCCSVLNGKKGITGGISYAIHWYAEADCKYVKDYDKNK